MHKKDHQDNIQQINPHKGKTLFPDQKFLKNSQFLLKHLIALKIRNVKKYPYIFIAAFVHSSYLNENKNDFFSHIHDYERLEFIGDSILNHLVSEYVFLNYSNLKEGDLSKLRSKLIQKQTLIRAAKNLKLNDYIFLGYGELKKLSKNTSKIFSDVFEALTGAVFVTSGITGTKEFLNLYFFPMIKKLLESSNNEYLEDYKTKLQEFFHRFKGVKVQYLTKIIPHQKNEEFLKNKNIFMTSILVNDEVIASAFDYSKKLSEKKAAGKAYHYLSENLDFIKKLVPKN